MAVRKEETLMTLSRQYVPAVGARVTLRTWEDYGKVTGKPCNWSCFTVREVRPETDCVTIEHYNAGDTGEFYAAHLSQIKAPIGWQSQYTIYCKPEQVDNALSWFARGIVVRQSHDMSGSMPTAFQPMDNSAAPHWQFPEVTDAVPADECRRVFRVVKVERENVYDVYLVPQTECPYCHGTGKRHVQTIADARKVALSDVLADSELIARLEGYDTQTRLFTCHCIRGGFRTLGRSKRAKLIKEWALQGWDTHYCNYGEHSFWERTRETVVQDWDE